MSLFRRLIPDPELERARAEASREQARADLERARVEAQIQRERQAADAEFARQQTLADEEEKRRRDGVRRAEREERSKRRRKARAEFAAKLRPVLPLLLINGGAAYAQGAYAYEEIAPAHWNTPSKVAFAVAFSAALESIAVYVQWHAHDALLLNAHATAAGLRRAAWGIAGVVAAINYAHFAGEGMAPTSAAVAFALLSLLSPWLWGLHTRRAQHVQLLAEDANLIDEGGVEFSPQRRRAFPFRAWQARRWSIDHGERDPRRAWDGYNRDRRRQLAQRPPAGRLRAAVTVLRGKSVPAGPVIDGEVSDKEQELIDLVLAQARAAGPRLRARTATARSFHWPAPPAIPPTTTRHDDGLDALVVATSEPATPPAIDPPPARQPEPTEPATVATRQPAIVAAAAPATRITRRVAIDPPVRPAKSNADRVAELVAKKPAMTQEQVAKKLGLGIRTVQRYWPKNTTTDRKED
ncbi:hypothetical protein [Micromonospora sp. WMMD980]|uniref:hypothetical protein n=1 Tax=Micromonospora sp. WMMD980 TaxID=3016088 RepID=UPI002416945A|nr:hypothetical protein [Micromonospora sp. WMMD980]MDG4798990.1 hypothetical protein [Micromonospora sp. WMMD980]MDG4799006.1 hypothetical protein [Micromonospora sp. WMMD980]MDG4799072.1 hypothetical protein [Micromonospora sp. WMMD980]